MNNARRKALGEIQDQLTDLQSALELFKDEEQECYDNLPEGIQDSERGDAMLEVVDYLEVACDNLQYAIDNISEAIEA